jgi:hypothetical protein
MTDPPLDIDNHLAGMGLIPAPIKLLGRQPELDDEIVRQVLRFDLAAFFAPEPKKGVLIVAHDDSRIRAADERSPPAAIFR